MTRAAPAPKIGRPAKPYPKRYQLRHSETQMDLTKRTGAWMTRSQPLWRVVVAAVAVTE